MGKKLTNILLYIVIIVSALLMAWLLWRWFLPPKRVISEKWINDAAELQALHRQLVDYAKSRDGAFPMTLDEVSSKKTTFDKAAGREIEIVYFKGLKLSDRSRMLLATGLLAEKEPVHFVLTVDGFFFSATPSQFEEFKK